MEETHAPALLLFAHGSTLCGSGESLEVHASRLRESGKYVAVQIGFLNYTDPLFQEAVDLLFSAGHKNIVVVPYFLINGYFVTNSLPQEIAAAQAKYPELRFTVASALCTDDLLADALLESAATARERAAWNEPMRRASLFCRPVPDCPLFGTPSCPKMPVRPSGLEAAAHVL